VLPVSRPNHHYQVLARITGHRIRYTAEPNLIPCYGSVGHSDISAAYSFSNGTCGEPPTSDLAGVLPRFQQMAVDVAVHCVT
jgi:hypothetical protein